jgi:hypothetical protein
LSQFRNIENIWKFDGMYGPENIRKPKQIGGDVEAEFIYFGVVRN